MKIVFDLSHPKQVRFFAPMMRALRQRGAVVSAVSRDWIETNLALQHLGIRAKTFGQHGGGDLLAKVLSSVERVQHLAQRFARNRPDVLVTLANPDSSRAAFGLGIPIVSFIDLPEAEAVCRLSLPLASKVCTPWIVPKRELLAYGAPAANLFFYRALDPVVWLESHRVNGAYARELHLDSDRPIVVCRETGWQSSYVRTDVVKHVADHLRRRHRSWQIVDIPRYRPHPFLDVPSLLANADLLIGGGGTMCIEAAYYGTPVIATRPVHGHYLSWLFDKQLAEPSATAHATIERAEQLIANQSRQRSNQRRARAKRLFGKMKFPLERVIDLILSAAQR